jgi:hypothetical protein
MFGSGVLQHPKMVSVISCICMGMDNIAKCHAEEQAPAVDRCATTDAWSLSKRADVQEKLQGVKRVHWHIRRNQGELSAMVLQRVHDAAVGQARCACSKDVVWCKFDAVANPHSPSRQLDAIVIAIS